MQYVIAIVIIAIILYWTWEILLMLFLLYGIGIIAKSIYKIRAHMLYFTCICG